jgi:hypothetical protein
VQLAIDGSTAVEGALTASVVGPTGSGVLTKLRSHCSWPAVIETVAASPPYQPTAEPTRSAALDSPGMEVEEVEIV